MKIYVSTQILSGNLGYGWNDENETADALGEYTTETWMADLAPVIAEGHEVEIDIDVQHNTTGATQDVSVTVYGDTDDTYDLEDRVDGLLTEKSRIWERFCDSDEAAELTE